MTKEQYETLAYISSALEVLAHAGDGSTGLSYDMAQVCKALEEKILDFVEKDAEQYLQACMKTV